jgi:hypothetical protein
MFDNFKAYVLIGLGLWAIFFGLNKSDPMPEDLMQVSGTLERAEVYEECDRGSGCTRYVILTIAGASSRYWTHAIRPDQLELLGGVGSNIELYAARNPTYRPIDGNAAKSWGLTVNSRIIMRMEESLIYENVMWQVVIPLLGGVDSDWTYYASGWILMGHAQCRMNTDE